MEFGMKFFISLALTLASFVFIYILLFTDVGPRVVDTANYYIFAPIGITVSMKPFAQIAPAGFLDAKITLAPEGKVCSFEPVYFSAKDTTLPKGYFIQNASCYWDFDLSSEPCDFYSTSNPPPQGLNCAFGAVANNSNKEDDYESTNCYITNSSGPWPSSGLSTKGEKKGVKLVVVDPTGKSANATTIVTSNLFCACAASKPCSINVELTPPLGKELYNSNSTNISFDSGWEFTDIHLIVEPASGHPKDLKIDVGDDGTADYSFGGNLTSPTVVYGMNLAHAVEKVRASCRQKPINPCPVPFMFYFQGNGSMRIKEVWMPLSDLKQS